MKKALQHTDRPSDVGKIMESLQDNNTQLDIAITGESGSGKSTFVNALRELSDGDEGAAPTGVTETTSEVTPYPHPKYPTVILWDLPGIGTTKFPADKYLELVGFEKFDFFIIISDSRFRENDVKLAQEIQRMEKKFYFVHSKIDNDLERSQREFKVEKTLSQIRQDCIQGLRGLGIKTLQVFLVSSFQLHQYDFPLLRKALESGLPEVKRDALLLATPSISHEIISKKKEAFKVSETSTDNQFEIETVREEIKEALLKNDKSLAITKIKELLDKERNTPLNIAITGESGSGKSTFVNAFRGMDNREEGAALTGVTETTSEVTPYPHPNYPKVTLWDLPGIGTTKFPADKYLERVGFEKFDFFIIVSADRFRENDVKLAQEIQRMEKKFYFVRSKIDTDLRPERRKRNFSEEETLRKMRENCIQGLRDLGVESPQVFLVSSFELHLYGFSLLHETLDRDLPEHQRHALLRAMPNISLEIIDKKKKTFKRRLYWLSALSAAVAAVPVPGLSIAVDIGVLVGAVTDYVFGFGLDIKSLQRLSASTGVPHADLHAAIVSPLAAVKISKELLLKVLRQIAGAATFMALEEVSRFIPIVGIPLAMVFSFTTTYRLLNFILNQLAEDAQKVFKKALGLNTSV
ncbi:interferon-inducible GTPase 5-like [Pelmatolapia mariae]|uniref:interferon-inducible GTPase 5-like n=1 Tax=Pelmatolapia mariae TaxID=158779 RepID=UPI002FE5B372